MMFLFSAFVFMDLSANDDKDLPEELRNKYTMSKMLGRLVDTSLSVFLLL